MIYDALVIGGGFYGAMIAAYLAGRRGISRVGLFEQGSRLLERASYNNQARVHNGYHYPRSFTTAFRSRVNLPRFVRDFQDAVKSDFNKIYAIASRNSRVTARQFERFCREIGARIEPAPQSLAMLFERRLVEKAFLVEEYAFDAEVLRHAAREELDKMGVDVVLSTKADALRKVGGRIEVSFTGPAGQGRAESRLVFNCTYSGLGRLMGGLSGIHSHLKHEITELALLKVPSVLHGLGVTIMDGPFFSMMPFPPRGLHTLSHVRYTPHLHWVDEPSVDPNLKLDGYNRISRVDRMIRDSERFMPAIGDSQYVESIFEIKTVLVKNEGDDGRPILFERHADLPGCYSILGGKIDNIYDIFELLNADPLLQR